MVAGKRIREEREKRGWTQGDLSEHSGTNRDTISGIESGRHRPRPSTLRKIAGAFGIEIRELFEVSTPKAAYPLEYPPVLTLSDEELDKLKRNGEYDEVSNLLRQLTEWFSEHRPGPMTDVQRQEWERAHPGTDRYLARAAQIIIELRKRRKELEQESHSIDGALEQMEEYAAGGTA